MQNQQNKNKEEEINTQKNQEIVGPVIGSILIIIMILLGGIYFWSLITQDNDSNVNLNDIDQNNPQEEQQEQESQQAEIQAELQTEATSTEPTDTEDPSDLY